MWREKMFTSVDWAALGTKESQDNMDVENLELVSVGGDSSVQIRIRAFEIHVEKCGISPPPSPGRSVHREACSVLFFFGSEGSSGLRAHCFAHPQGWRGSVDHADTCDTGWLERMSSVTVPVLSGAGESSWIVMSTIGVHE